MRTAGERVLARLGKKQVMTSLSISLSEDAVSDLQEIAPTLGFAEYEGLVKAYISEGLRRDMERLEGSQVQALTESLRKRGVADEAISAAMVEAGLKTA